MKYPDCFARANSRLDNRAACTVTFCTDCEGCKFYKTEAQFRTEQQAAAERLSRRGLNPCIKTVRGYYRSGVSYEKQIMSTKRRSSE